MMKNSHIRDAWAQVRVRDVNIAEDDGGLRASAVVYLGRLTPADVHVELGNVADAGAVEGCMDGRRMWSSCVYHNGSFLFETPIPDGGTHFRDGWLVRVHPAGITQPAVEEPLVWRDQSHRSATRSP